MLVVTVQASDEFHDDVQRSIEALHRGEHVDSTPTISFESYDDLLETVTPRTLDLIEAVRRDEPESINEATRVVDRDVNNVHEELGRLARRGIIYFEDKGRSKRPVVWFDELVIDISFDPEVTDATTAAPYSRRTANDLYRGDRDRERFTAGARAQPSRRRPF